MKLVVCFPGIGYHCDKPLLYYSRKLAAAAGYDHEIALNYTYRKAGLRGNDAALREAFDALYTPLALTFEFAPQKAIAFLGTADPWSDVDAVAAQSRANGTPLHLYAGANHSLETADVLGNLDALRDVMQKTQAFVAGENFPVVEN